MKHIQRFAIYTIFGGGLALGWQGAAPVPPAAPAAPMPAAQPAPAPLPRADFPDRVLLEQDARTLSEQAREMAEQAREQARQMAEEQRKQGLAMAGQERELALQMAEQAREQARQAAEEMRLGITIPGPAINLNLDLQGPQGVRGGVTPPVRTLRMGNNDNSLYGRGQRALDDHRYSEALDAFTEVVARGGPKADGALYWKAYALNKLGRRDDALAAISQLRTSFPSSHWLEDAKALELEVKQASGKPVTPEGESDDDLKLMALNGLAQTDPARAFPLLEKLLKGPASPKLKKNAIYVLAVNTSPQAQQLLEQIARGNGNPDLQITAIDYMLSNKQSANRTQVLFEIYNSTSDTAVKRRIISALASNNDTAHLLQIYKAEKDSSLRRDALADLGNRGGSGELWQLYQAETTPEGKMQILDAMYSNGNTERLLEVARTDKDPKVRTRAIDVLASYRAENLDDKLTGLYASEQDPQVKRTILNLLSSRRDAKALVDIYRKESNFDLKKSILSHLGNMHTPEANELYMEILK